MFGIIDGQSLTIGAAWAAMAVAEMPYEWPPYGMTEDEAAELAASLTREKFGPVMPAGRRPLNLGLEADRAWLRALLRRTARRALVWGGDLPEDWPGFYRGPLGVSYEEKPAV